MKKSKFNFSSLPSSIYIFILLFIVSSLFVPSFFTPANFSTILEQSSVLVLISIGVAFPIMTGGTDLSAGGVISFTGIVMGVLLNKGIPDLFALSIGLLVGVIFGVCNGMLVNLVNVPPFIATFGTMGVAQSLANFFSDSRTVYWKENTTVAIIDLLRKDILTIYFGNENSMVLRISVIIPFVVLIVVIIMFLFKKTSLEANIYAIGHNKEVARLSGINVNKFSIGAYVISGLMAGIAAIILLTRTNSATPTMGNGMEFQAVVSAIIGGNSQRGGKGSLPGAILGAFSIFIIRNSVNYLGLNSFLAMIITGLTLLLGMVINEAITSLDNKKGVRL